MQLCSLIAVLTYHVFPLFNPWLEQVIVTVPVTVYVICPVVGEVDEVNDEPSNGLENFGIEEQTPELFNSEEDNFVKELDTTLEEKRDTEEDDLEIPAFLRRQKN